MSAFVIVSISVVDPIGYEHYRAAVPYTLGPYAGSVLAWGGRVTVMEGRWIPGKLVLLRFPSAAHAAAWWGSKEYAQSKSMLKAATRSDLVFVDGGTETGTALMKDFFGALQ